MNHTFKYEYKNLAPNPITIEVDSAGIIIKATLYSREIGEDVDVLLQVLKNKDLMKTIMDDFYFKERENRINKEFGDINE